MAIRDLLLKISGDGDDAKRELATVSKQVADFGRQEAEAKISVDARDVERPIARAKRELRDFGRISVEAAAGVEIEKGEAQITRLKARLDNLSQQTASPKVDAAVAKAIADLARVQARVDKLKLARAEVKVDVDQGSVGILNSITAAVASLATSMGSGGGGGLSGATTRISAGFVSFGTVAGPLSAVLLALAVTIGVSLVGALAALVASLAAAVAAVGALATALAGALGPVLAVVIAAVARFAKVIQAFKAQSAAAQQAQQQAISGSGAVTAAANQQEAAARSLTDANRRLGEATTQAYREMADAAEAASDAVRSLEQAQLSREQANLSTRQAIEALADLRTELGATGDAYSATFEKFTDVSVDTSGLRAALAAVGKASGGAMDTSDELRLEQAILNVRQARLSEKEAIDGVSDAERNRLRTQQRANEFARQGIAASEGYSSALRAVADAQRQVAQATADSGIAAAQAKATVLTDDLSAAERRLLVVIQQVSVAIRDAFNPAVAAVFGGLVVALRNVTTLAKALAPAFTAIGVAIGSALAVFSGELVKPEWINGLTTLSLAGAQLTGIFTEDIFIPFLEILRDVAVAAVPFLIRGLRSLGAVLQGLSEDASMTTLTPIFEVLVDNLKSWLRLAGALTLVMVAFFKTAQAPGRSLVDTMTAGALALASWLNSKAGMEAVRNFFERTLPTAIAFVKAMVAITGAFVRMAIVLAPIVTLLLQIFTALLRVSHAGLLVRDTLIGGVGEAIKRIGPAFTQMLDLVKLRLQVLVLAIGRVGAAFKTAFDFAKRQVSSALTTIGGTLNAFVTTATTIGGKIGRGLVQGIRSAIGGIASLGRAIANGLISAINFAATKINQLLPDKINLKGLPDINLPDNPIPTIPKLAVGGITTGPALAQIGEAGQEAILPLTKRVFSDLAAAITAQMRLATPSMSRMAVTGSTPALAGGAGGTVIENFHTHIQTPSGELPDATTLANRLHRRIERVGGDVRQS